MESLAPSLAAVLDVRPPASARDQPIPELMADLRGAPRLAVLGVDALGRAQYDYWRERMPFLSGMLGERCAWLRSTLPSKTPVNFGCMVTGAPVVVHGAMERTRDFLCETLFDVLRAAGRTSAAIGRRNWSADALLGRYADLSARGEAATDGEVERIVAAAIDGDMPDFLITQFTETDETFHAFGPYAPDAGVAVAHADAWLARHVNRLRRSGYGIVITADHGQHEVTDEAGVVRGKHGTASDEDCIVPLTWTR